MNDYQILHNAPLGATHFDGKTYFRFEMYEHGQAYLVLKNGVWDRGLPAYPVYSCRCLDDIKKAINFIQKMDNLRDDLIDQLSEPFGELEYEIIKNQSAKRWINVNEKLPEKNTYVLMATTSGHVCTTFYTEPTNRLIDCKISAWFEHANNFHYEVTHWQPLPKAPEKWI